MANNKIISSIIALLLILLPESLGNSTQEISENSPQKVKVGIWLVNLQKFELSTGSYDVDFYLWFKGKGDVNYEFMNGRASSIDIIKKDKEYLEIRVRGTFLKSLNFKDYPFDKHRLTIEIEDKNLDITQLIFLPDLEESGIDPFINIAGWNIEDWKIESIEHQYPGDSSFSRIIFSFTIGRSTLSSILKSIIPISIITCIAMLAFFISPSNYAQRIGLGVTTLLAAVANHLALTSQIPPIGYLTLADKVMITAYGMFLYSLMISVLLMKLVDQKKNEEAQRLNRRAGIMLPVIALILILGLVLLT